MTDETPIRGSMEATVLPLVNIPEKVAAKSAKKSGLVGFYDVLGFESFLENNSDDYASAYMFELLKEVPAFVKEYQERLAAEADREVKDVVAALEYVGFSDTLVFTLAVPDDQTKYLCWLVFSYATAMLQRKMFEKGLPIRGGIAYGDYWIDGNLLAGKPFVEAHKASLAVDAALVVLSRQTEKLYRATGFSEKPGLAYLIDYPVPHKDGSAEKGIAVDFSRVNSVLFESLKADPRQLVTKSFGGHRKSVVPAVYQKLTNTEMFLRHVVKTY